MSVLVYHPDSDVRSMLAFKLNAAFHLEILAVESPDEALAALEANHGIQLIICEQTDGSESLLHRLAVQKVKIPCIICHQDELQGVSGFADLMVIGFVEESKIAEGIEKLIRELIQNRTVLPGDSNLAFCPIGTSLLIRVSPLKADIYIRLSSKKLIKLFREGDDFNLEDLKKYYQKKKVETMYLRRSETGEFLQKLTDELRNLLNSSDFDEKSSREIASAAHETLRELSHRVGFTPEIQEAAKQAVALSVKSMGKSPRLNQVLKRIQSEADSYISSHSMKVAHVACSIAEGIDWKSETTFHKLTLAAFFHDFTLHNQELAAIQTLEELEKSKDQFSEQEIQSFRLHPIKAGELVRSLSEVPPDVDLIVSQHHERADGSGFPRKATGARIGALSAIFIISHDLVHFMIQAGDQFKLEKFLKIYYSSYSGSHFRKAFQALKESGVQE
jgi:HD-GYP domain-containing protein (c-di-GMP phosphodiesterase class II)